MTADNCGWTSSWDMTCQQGGWGTKHAQCYPFKHRCEPISRGEVETSPQKVLVAVELVLTGRWLRSPPAAQFHLVLDDAQST